MTGSRREPIWRVQVAGGQIRRWTLDELDAAYRDGVVDEGSFVLAEGCTEWKTLAQILSETPEPSEHEAPLSVAPPPVVADIDFAPSELDDVDDLMAFRPKRRRWVTALVAAAAIGGAVFATRHQPIVHARLVQASAVVANVRGAIGRATASPATAATAAPPPAAAPAPAPAPASAPSPPAATAAKVAASASASARAPAPANPPPAKHRKAPSHHHGSHGAGNGPALDVVL